MIRRLVKRVWRHFRPTATPPPAPSVARPLAPADPPDIEIEGPKLREWLTEPQTVLVDVREPNELLAGHAQNALLIPMNQVPDRLAELDRHKRIVVYCAAGARSLGVASYLRDNGFTDAWSLIGGFGSFLSEGGAYVRPPSNAKYGIASRASYRSRPVTVQAIHETAQGMRYTVQDAAGVRSTDVPEAELATR